MTNLIYTKSFYIKLLYIFHKDRTDKAKRAPKEMITKGLLKSLNEKNADENITNETLQD